MCVYYLDEWKTIVELEKKAGRKGTNEEEFAPGKTVTINSVDDLDISDVYDVYTAELDLDGKDNITG